MTEKKKGGVAAKRPPPKLSTVVELVEQAYADMRAFIDVYVSKQREQHGQMQRVWRAVAELDVKVGVLCDASPELQQHFRKVTIVTPEVEGQLTLFKVLQ